MALFMASATLIGLVRFVGYFDYIVRSLQQRSRVRPRDAELLRRVVPRLPQRFEDARTEEEVVGELWRFAEEAELDFVELLGDDEQPLAAWSRPSMTPGKGRASVTATYPLGRDGASHAAVRFGWSSDFGDVPPECDILLQVAADILMLSLARRKSRLAPSRLDEAIEVPDAIPSTGSAPAHGS